MLSIRGKKSAASQDIPWRFAPGGNNRYDRTSNPSGVISFGTAENNLMHEELRQFTEENVSIPSLAFAYRFSTMGGPRFPVAMAAHMNEYFNPNLPVKPEHIITGSGLTAIHDMLAWNLGDIGDGILVSRPVYGRFELDFGNTAGLEIIYADTGGIDPFDPVVVEQLQAAFEMSESKGVKIKALLIVNPHNPLGRCYPSSTLQALMKFCETNAIHFISDEVYALSVYDTDSERALGFTSVLSIDSDSMIDPKRVHVLYGMSKDFAAAGLRLGCLITRNSDMLKAMAANIRFHGPSGISIAIGTAILEDRSFVASFLQLSQQRLKESRNYTTNVLDAAGIGYDGRANAGLFLYIDLRPWIPAGVTEYALAQRLLDAGVGVHPCEEHGESKGWFRLVFSQERDVLAEGLRRMTSVLNARFD